jgi:hypothetical protein
MTVAEPFSGIRYDAPPQPAALVDSALVKHLYEPLDLQINPIGFVLQKACFTVL